MRFTLSFLLASLLVTGHPSATCASPQLVDSAGHSLVSSRADASHNLVVTTGAPMDQDTKRSGDFRPTPASGDWIMGGVGFCTDPGWNTDSGFCLYTTYLLDTCISLSPPYNKSISSFGTVMCTLCVVYEDANCTDSQAIMQFDGYDSARDDGGIGSPYVFDDRISSFKCSATCEQPQTH